MNLLDKLDMYIHEGFKKGIDTGPFGMAYSAEGWSDREKYGKEHHPMLLKIHTTIENTIDFITMSWERYISDPKWYVYHRFFKRTHLIDTKLPKGAYLETFDKMLYGVMGELVDFIDNQKSGYPWELDELTKQKQGIENLIDEGQGMNDSQWQNMEIAWEIYSWWKNYPNRLKELDAILGKVKCDEDTPFLEQLSNTSDETKAVYGEHWDAEEALQEEEKVMLTRLINIRYSLWT